MLSAFSVEHCPPSRWNTVRHQHGIVSAIAWNTQNCCGGLPAPRKHRRFRHQDREWRQRGKWPQMEALVWTQEWVALSPGCRRVRFLPKSDPAAPFFVLHRSAQRTGGLVLGTRFFVPVSVQEASRKGATKAP
ncbi:hypothetical protein E4O93_14220 [Diaphorobacter sp. DS2]|nr:hypothetical protein E4O93_14220 [Diaphorobacter sp. DS2]